ncbi:MAG: phosphotransferase [Phycisphaerales bacterium]
MDDARDGQRDRAHAPWQASTSVGGAPNEGAFRGWETYTPAEVDTVLARYDIGRVERAHEYRRGSRSAPKLKIWASAGVFLLKRRGIQRHPIARIQFAHALQAHLAAERYPVAPLLRVRETGSTLLLYDEHAYELFGFVEGDRFDKSKLQAMRAGEALGELHRYASEFDTSAAPPASFHESRSVRAALDRLADAICAASPSANREPIDELSRELRILYTRAGDEIDLLGFRGLSRHVVHGDWHPGNLIFGAGAVSAVIDFDSARVEPWVTEVANGMLQFAIRGEGNVSPLEWPDDLDPKRMRSFLLGYLTTAPKPLTQDERSMMPWMMIEAMIAESAIPVANHGTFADLPGSDFMGLVLRKCQWVRQHRRAISEL